MLQSYGRWEFGEKESFDSPGHHRVTDETRIKEMVSLFLQVAIFGCWEKVGIWVLLGVGTVLGFCLDPNKRGVEGNGGRRFQYK